MTTFNNVLSRNNSTTYTDSGIEGLYIGIELITPEIAELHLEEKSPNRNISQSNVEVMARAMSTGQWREDAGDPIRFNTEGIMIDGQHRMWAVIESGLSFKFVVIHGINTETQMIMDTGRRRTLQDQLRIRGEANCNGLAGALGYYSGWLMDGTVMQSSVRRLTLTIPESLALLQEHPELRQAVVMGDHVRRTVRGGTGRWSAMYAILANIDVEDTDAFFSRIKSGENLSEGSPIKALRKRLLDDALARSKMPSREYSALVFKAWNFYREGREVAFLSYKAGGASPEKYPVPI